MFVYINDAIGVDVYWSIICKGPKYRFPLPTDFKSCREEFTGALQEFCNRWCKREHVESNAVNSWKLNIFKIPDGRIVLQQFRSSTT